MMRPLAAAAVLWATSLHALDLDAPFDSIDGGTLAISDWAGQPVLVVNTASLCAFTPQFRDLQDLYDVYREDGLVVLAVPSDDFRQELGSDTEVKEFCELEYGIDMPMTTITTITGEAAHPFFLSLREDEGLTPGWNFQKVLIAPDGTVAGTWGSTVRPGAPAIRRQIEQMLDD